LGSSIGSRVVSKTINASSKLALVSSITIKTDECPCWNSCSKLWIDEFECGAKFPKLDCLEARACYQLLAIQVCCECYGEQELPEHWNLPLPAAVTTVTADSAESTIYLISKHVQIRIRVTRRPKLENLLSSWRNHHLVHTRVPSCLFISLLTPPVVRALSYPQTTNSIPNSPCLGQKKISR
jgi:hypothetical protein